MDIKEAIRFQKNLAKKLKLNWVERKVNLIAGFDATYKGDKIIGSCSVLSFPELNLIEERVKIKDITFPYIPSLLAFRELPVFLELFKSLKNYPDLIIIDGNGIAHPRKTGLATHFGIILNIPTIGCAKNPFYPVEDPPPQRGKYTFMKNEKNEIVGVALRTREGVKPVYVSPGYLINLEKSIKFILNCSIYRIPEPLRRAHQTASKLSLEKFSY
ncbi:endonuclease V [Candidatus Aminicenantes bacterium AC-335-A11]|jgi:deoxyribonuclease V|nr:endonuclease V [SCandidatus Aminicenantes bacterium Aminicenantia_JdfR_composite]MCP2597377.1 endonuclease V [Candidatus Aminicenantes bacterium AC-335-G13]MCP2618923.1 endonuclease V [Candidatus Aminicenantes bacterium AC-335-A11]